MHMNWYYVAFKYLCFLIIILGVVDDNLLQAHSEFEVPQLTMVIFGNVYIWYVCILGVRPCVQCSILYRCTAFAEATV